MPAPLAGTIRGPGACVPSVSWQGLAWSSVRLRTVSNVAHSQLAGTCRGRSEGQEGPSAISASQLLPSFLYPVPPFPYWNSERSITHWCVTITGLDTNPKHSTLQAAVKKINSTPATASTRVSVRGWWQLVTSGPQTRQHLGKTGHVGHQAQALSTNSSFPNARSQVQRAALGPGDSVQYAGLQELLYVTME